MEAFNISSGGYDVLRSGSVITYDSSAEISFELKMNEVFSFNFIMKFIEEKNEVQDIQITTSNNDIICTCVNFNNPLGTGYSRPIQLAVFNDKKVYLNFWVIDLGQKSLKQVMYTFYLER